MKSRTEIVCRGWLYALPFVLAGPVVFWLLIAPTKMLAWSWSGLLNIYQYGIPMIGMSVLAHILAFLIFGLPLFFVFWAKPSIVWSLPVSLSLGLILAAVFGFPEYFSGGYLSVTTLFLCLGYGAATAIGCWIANRRSEAVTPNGRQPPSLNSSLRDRP